MTGEKHDAGKPSWSLLPLYITREVVNVLTFGAYKYSRDNWRKVDNLQIRYYDALLRHVDAYRGGETHDPESGFHHLAHAICCIMFMAEDQILGTIDEQNASESNKVGPRTPLKMPEISEEQMESYREVMEKEPGKIRRLNDGE